MTIGELPSSYVETMSYYEMILWFVNYIKTQVIPVINNNANILEELKKIVDDIDVNFEELQNEIDELDQFALIIRLNYFYSKENKLTEEEKLHDNKLTEICKKFYQEKES